MSRPSHLVVVEHHLGRRRTRLAGQHIAGLELPALERVVDVHRDLALDEAGAAGAAPSPPARIRAPPPPPPPPPPGPLLPPPPGAGAGARAYRPRPRAPPPPA